MLETTDNKLIFDIGEDRTYIFNIRFFEEGDLEVYLQDQDGIADLLTYGQDYTVGMLEGAVDYSSGGKVTLLQEPLSTSRKLIILRKIPATQTLSLPEFGRLPSRSLEMCLDRLVMISQQIMEKLDRAVVASPGSEAFTRKSIVRSCAYSVYRSGEGVTELISGIDGWCFLYAEMIYRQDAVSCEIRVRDTEASTASMPVHLQKYSQGDFLSAFLPVCRGQVIDAVYKDSSGTVVHREGDLHYTFYLSNVL